MIVRIREYDKPVRLAVSKSQAESLKSYSNDLKARLGLPRQPLAIIESAGNIYVSAAGFAGFFSVDGVRIEVAPKFLGGVRGEKWKDAFFLILSKLERTYSDWSFGHGGFSSEIPDIAATIITDTLELAERLGDARKYIERRDALPLVRGRLVPSAYWERVVRPDKIICEFQDYSEDVAPNQLMKWALRVLIPEVSSESLLSRMERQIARLVNVSDARPPFHEHELRLSPQFAYCKPGIDVAKMVAGNQLAGLDGGNSSNSIDLVWATAPIFEDFVFLLFDQSVRRLGGSVSKTSLPLATASPAGAKNGDESFSTTPDILIEIPRVKLLFDAKYKNLSKSPRNSDVYQVVTGSKLVEADLCGLIYPGLPLIRKRRRWSLLIPGKPKILEVFLVDLTEMGREGGFDRLLNLIQEWLTDLAQELR